MKKAKKVLAFVLSVIMVLSILPAIPLTASAETEGIFEYYLWDENYDDEYDFAIITGVTDQYVGGDIIIPSTIGGYPVKTINQYAFSGCTGFKSVTLPDSITTIEDTTFSGCTGLKNVTIPNNITSIGYGAFRDCTALTEISIPSSVTSIGSCAFEGCKAIKNINIPDSVTDIGSYAFGDCSKLQTLVIPDGVKTIGHSAFKNCKSLESIVLSNSITSIDNGLFYNCIELKSIIMPDSVVSIGDAAFYNCAGLTSVVIPDHVTTINGSAFADCTGLRSITIPNSVTNIGGFAFYNCKGITTITIPNSVTSIGQYAFNDCTGLKQVKISKSLTLIYLGAFSGCNELESIEIPDSITLICNGAFHGCTKLKSVVIPDSVTKIENNAFNGCFNLTHIYYTGSYDNRTDIVIGEYNEHLNIANWHYNYVPCETHSPAAAVKENEKAATYTADGSYDEVVYCSICGIEFSRKTVKVPIKVGTFKITYTLNGGKNNSANPVSFKTNAAVTLKDPTKKGYTFAGWYDGSTKIVKIAKGTSKNITLTAKWTLDKYIITYKDGKNSANPTSYYVTSLDITLKNPTKKGYTFAGWYNGSKKVTKISKGSTGNITLTAKWSKDTYKITYKLAGGKNASGNPKTYTVTSSTITLKSPTRKGYKFGGWYSDSKFKNKVTKIAKGSTGNKTLYAKWTAITYKITYKLNSGKNSSKNPKSYKITSSAITLKAPTRKGYTFKGWYNGSKKVTTIKKGSTGNITLTAKWKKK